MLIAQSLFII